MLTLDQIYQYFPPSLMTQNPKHLLVEYVQVELLDSIYKQPLAKELSFIGGTASRIVYENNRFSEDLDFDNFGLSFDQFDSLFNEVIRDMKGKGFSVEFRLVEKGAWHCYCRFPQMLYQHGLSSNAQEKILVSIDAERKERTYSPIEFTINRFGVYRKILVAPAPILLSQKLMTVLSRKRQKGRDYYDVSFLLSHARPDMDYLRSVGKLDVDDLSAQLKAHFEHIDLNTMANDVEPFLFNPLQKERVLSLPAYLEQIGLIR